MAPLELESEAGARVRRQLAADSLRIGGRLRFRPRGDSMLPAVEPGRDVEITRFAHGGGEAAVGDIVLADAGERLVLHRVVDVTADAVITRGDRHLVNDPPWRFAQVLGRWVEPRLAVPVTVGGMTVRVHTTSPEFAAMLIERYRGFIAESNGEGDAAGDLMVDLVEHTDLDPDHDLEVSRHHGRTWRLTRGDFRASWDPVARRGRVQQNANPYSIDSVLRVIHSLAATARGGFLLHSASAVRNGRAYLMSGKSGAGKTTISRLAPPSAALLTDEISYVLPGGDGVWRAWGTPFFGELARPGENTAAPLAAACFLAKGPENIMDRLSEPDAARALLGNILFFARDAALVNNVFENACRFAAAVPAYRLTFRPDPAVWELLS